MVSFVILTWNSEKFIAACLDALTALRPFPFECIVVDNGSSDGTLAILDAYTEKMPELKTIRLEKNTGTTVSRNKGIAAVSEDSEYICILDSDAFITREALEKMIAALETDPANGICGPYMENLQGLPQLTAKKIPTAVLKFCKAFPVKAVQQIGVRMEEYDFPEKTRAYPVGYLISACWLLRRKMIGAIGPLDEKIFYSPEDVEYCVRAWQNGWRVLYVPDAKIIHAVQRISKKKLFSRHNWEHVKGLVYFFRKYHLFFSTKQIKVN